MRLPQHQEMLGELYATWVLKTVLTRKHHSKQHHQSIQSHVTPAKGPSDGRETKRGTSAFKRE